ncbi:MAG: GGDEF domain-containing protein [Treponemataceae bacterium]|nr:GGDEF domain-containing protein [Treponemataceae bacterium]
MRLKSRMSYWMNAGQEPTFFKDYRNDIHQYTVSFASVFYKIMTAVFFLLLGLAYLIPLLLNVPDFIYQLRPFMAVYTAYMALCHIIFAFFIQKSITASFIFTQVTLLIFGVLLLWLSFYKSDQVAVYMPVYFVLFPMLVTVPVPTLIADILILYVLTIVGTNIFKSPEVIYHDVISTSICLTAGFFIGCKNIRSRLSEIKSLTKNMQKSALQKSVIDALVDEYECLATADFDNDIINVLLVNDNFSMNKENLMKIGSLSERIKEFAETEVHPDDKKRYIATMSKENIIKHMKDENSLAVNYRVLKDGQEPYVQTKLSKDINAPEGTNKFIMTHRSIDNEVKMEQMISNALKLASQDSLTGIRNRTAYDADLEQLKNRLSSGKQKEAGIVMVDVNWLKETNDKMGHTAGDDLLKSVSNVICSIYKHSPVYRIGGDEFAILLSPHDLRASCKLLQLARNSAAKTKYGVSFATGMAVFDKSDASFEDTIKRADTEMYKNKKEIKGSEPAETKKEEAAVPKAEND